MWLELYTEMAKKIWQDTINSRESLLKYIIRELVYLRPKEIRVLPI